MNRISISLFAGALQIGGGIAIAGLGACAHVEKTSTMAVGSAEPARDSSPDPKPAPAVKISERVRRVQATAHGFRVTENIQFADNKSDILPLSDSLLEEVATVIKENPHLLNIYIAGYASSEGTVELNNKLSYARARSVKQWLVTNGIDGNRISAGGYGSANPLGDNATEQGRELNRRVEFIAIKYVYDGKSYDNQIPPGAVTRE